MEDLLQQKLDKYAVDRTEFVKQFKKKKKYAHLRNSLAEQRDEINKLIDRILAVKPDSRLEKLVDDLVPEAGEVLESEQESEPEQELEIEQVPKSADTEEKMALTKLQILELIQKQISCKYDGNPTERNSIVNKISLVMEVVGTSEKEFAVKCLKSQFVGKAEEMTASCATMEEIVEKIEACKGRTPSQIEASIKLLKKGPNFTKSLRELTEEARVAYLQDKLPAEKAAEYAVKLANQAVVAITAEDKAVSCALSQKFNSIEELVEAFERLATKPSPATPKILGVRGRGRGRGNSYRGRGHHSNNRNSSFNRANNFQQNPNNNYNRNTNDNNAARNKVRIVEAAEDAEN